MSEDTQVETQSNNIKLKPILYEVKSVESLVIVVDGFVLCSPKCVMYVFLKAGHGAVIGYSLFFYFFILHDGSSFMYQDSVIIRKKYIYYGPSKWYI